MLKQMWWFHYSEKSRSGWGTTGAFNQSAGEEKRLIREGNQLERLKEEAITGAMRLPHSLRSKQAIHDDVKVNSSPLNLLPNITNSILSKCLMFLWSDLYAFQLLQLVGKKLNEIRKEILPFRAAVDHIEKVLQRIEKDMKSFDEQLPVLRRRKGNADQSIRQLRELHSEEVLWVSTCS